MIVLGIFSLCVDAQIQKTYYENTKKVKSEGMLADGKKTGVWKFYDEQGVLVEETNYVENLPDGISKI